MNRQLAADSAGLEVQKNGDLRHRQRYGRLKAKTRHIRNKPYSFTNCLTDTSAMTVLMRRFCRCHRAEAEHQESGEHQRRQ